MTGTSDWRRRDHQLLLVTGSVQSKATCSEIGLALDDDVVFTAYSLGRLNVRRLGRTRVNAAPPARRNCTFTILLGTPATVVVKPLFVTNRTLTVTKTGSGSGTVQSATGAHQLRHDVSTTAPAGTSSS